MGRLLAIDNGDKRIGLAISDPDQIISKPLKTLLLSDINFFFEKLLDIIRTESNNSLELSKKVKDGFDGEIIYTKNIEDN